MPTSGTPTRWNTTGVPSNTHLIRASSTHGTSSNRASVRGSPRSCSSTRRAVASTTRGLTSPHSTRRRKACSTPSAPVSASSCSRGVAARMAPSRISTMSSQRSASSITWLLTSSVVPRVGEVAEAGPELAAQHRVEPDGGLVQHQQPRSAEQRGGQRHTRPLAAGEAADRAVGAGGQVDRLDRLGHALVGCVEHAREVVEVLAGGQVEVDRGRLGDVADRRNAGRATRPAGPARRPGRRRRSGHRRSTASAWTCRIRWAPAGR